MKHEWGLVGCGYMAREYCKVLSSKGIAPQVYSRNLTSANVKTFEKTFSQLVVKEIAEVSDAIGNWLVCTNIESHEDVCGQLRGKVFCEKPFSHLSTYDTARDISILMNRRYYYWVEFMKEIIDAGKIVKVVACVPEKSVDALITQSIHVIDLLWYLTGAFQSAAKYGESSPTYVLYAGNDIPLVINMNYGSHENFSLRFYSRDGVVYEAKPLEAFAITEGMEVREPDDDNPTRTYIPVTSPLPNTPTGHKAGLGELVDDLIHNSSTRLPTLSEHHQNSRLDAEEYGMKICIIGVGNIGMRYVQGVSKTFPDAELFLVDRHVRLKELGKLALGNVKLFSSLNDVDEFIDLFVIATSCEPRLTVYKQCLQRKPQYIILEKYLFACREEFEDCLSLTRVPTFVNQWMYGSKTFDCLFNEEARSVKVSGAGWGLSCNAVHWIDVFKRHLNINHLQVGSGTAISEVFPSKRAGYEEISGELIFEDRDSDKSFKLIDRQDDSLIDGLKIQVDETDYIFTYGEIIRDEKVLSHFPYFSDLIGGIVSDIMDKGSCTLPTLEESVSQHLLMEEILESLDRRPNIT